MNLYYQAKAVMIVAIRVLIQVALRITTQVALRITIQVAPRITTKVIEVGSKVEVNIKQYFNYYSSFINYYDLLQKDQVNSLVFMAIIRVATIVNWVIINCVIKNWVGIIVTDIITLGFIAGGS